MRVASGLRTNVGTHNEELVAAEATNVVTRVDCAPQALAGGDQHQIPDPVAVHIVHLLEVIEIDEGNGQTRVASRHANKLTKQHLDRENGSGIR